MRILQPSDCSTDTKGKTEMVAGCWVRVQEITIPRAGFEYPLSKVLQWSVCPSLVCAVQAGIHSTSQALWHSHPECLYWAHEGTSDVRYIFVTWEKSGKDINQCLSFEVNSVLICLVYNLWCRYGCVTWCRLCHLRQCPGKRMFRKGRKPKLFLKSIFKNLFNECDWSSKAKRTTPPTIDFFSRAVQNSEQKYEFISWFRSQGILNLQFWETN